MDDTNNPLFQLSEDVYKYVIRLAPLLLCFGFVLSLIQKTVRFAYYEVDHLYLMEIRTEEVLQGLSYLFALIYYAFLFIESPHGKKSVSRSFLISWPSVSMCFFDLYANLLYRHISDCTCSCLYRSCDRRNESDRMDNCPLEALAWKRKRFSTTKKHMSFCLSSHICCCRSSIYR